MPDDDSTESATEDDQLLAMAREGSGEEALSIAQRLVGDARHAVEDGEADSGRGLVRSLEILGRVEQELGSVEPAQAAYQEALELAGKFGLPLEDLARLRTRAATLLDFSQREADAVPFYEQAIEDYERMEPAQPVVAAQIRNNLAMIYKGLGKFSLAEQHYLRALETLEQHQGPRSEEVAAVYNNLGGLYYTAGFAEQAKQMFTEAMNTRVDLLGPDHPDVAQSHCNLATVCHELGDDESSFRHFDSGLEILASHIKEEAAAYEAVAEDYLALLEMVGEERRAAEVRKRTQRVLAA